MEFEIDQFNKLIRCRRSVFPKDYTGEPVNREVIVQMLENARWAPTHKLTEPWQFVVFSGQGIKKLAEFQSSCYRKVAERDGSFKEEKFQSLLTKPLLSSHIIVIGMKRDEKKSIPEVEELGAVFCAIENMYLTAAAYGVGAYLSTGGITYFEEAKAFFGLNNEDRLIGFFHVGVSKVKTDGKRKPLDEKVKWIE